jgi:tRNA(Arg) A34 adenosine deaminase TadA
MMYPPGRCKSGGLSRGTSNRTGPGFPAKGNRTGARSAQRRAPSVAARNNAVRPKGDPTQHAEMLACGQAAQLLSEAALAQCTLYTSTEPCAMCAGAIYWIGIGRVVFALSETGLMRYTGSHEENPTLDLPCREVFARGQKPIAVVGPLLEDEAGKVHEGFWTK